MAFSMQGGGPLKAEINITPMIDVLLVLLVIFMLVVVMSDKKGLQAEIPQPADKTAQTPKIDSTIVIQIGPATSNRPRSKSTKKACSGTICTSACSIFLKNAPIMSPS